MEHAALGAEGIGGVLSMTFAPKWSRLAADQIRNLSLFTRLTSWSVREFSLSFERQLTCPLVDFCVPSTKFNLRMSRQQCSFIFNEFANLLLNFSRQTCYLSCTPSSFDLALLIVDKQAFFRPVDESKTMSLFSCRRLVPG